MTEGAVMERDTPRIMTWESANSPLAYRWCARFWIERIINEKGGGKSRSMEFHPVVFYDQSEEGVEVKAEKWWREELEKAERRKAGLEKARASRAASQ